MKLLLACIPALSKSESAHSSLPRLGSARIMPDGRLNPTPASPSRSRMYFGNIEYAGEINPHTGTKGLGYLRNLAVFNGQTLAFNEAFKVFLENPLLRQYNALYLEEGAFVTSDGLEFEAGGKGCVCVWCSHADEGPPEHRIAQYRPGEKFKLFPLPIFRT